MEKDSIIIFLQNLPTDSWGYEDVAILVAEGFALFQETSANNELN